MNLSPKLLESICRRQINPPEADNDPAEPLEVYSEPGVQIFIKSGYKDSFILTYIVLSID